MGGKSGHLSNDYNDNYGRDRYSYEERKTRCYKCNGSGTITEERECTRCDRQGTTWSNYNTKCSCNGYGRHTTTKSCYECSGKGYR